MKSFVYSEKPKLYFLTITINKVVAANAEWRPVRDWRPVRAGTYLVTRHQMNIEHG